MLGNATQCLPAHRIELPVSVEEADNPLRLFERLDQPVQQNPIEAMILPSIAAAISRAGGYRPIVPNCSNAANFVSCQGLSDNPVHNTLKTAG
jgi:hypothetical protein